MPSRDRLCISKLCHALPYTQGTGSVIPPSVPSCISDHPTGEIKTLNASSVQGFLPRILYSSLCLWADSLDVLCCHFSPVTVRAQLTWPGRNTPLLSRLQTAPLRIYICTARMLLKWKISKLYIADNSLYYYSCLSSGGKTIKTSTGGKKKKKNCKKSEPTLNLQSSKVSWKA